MHLRGRNAVVTGASSGIGRATALEMARRGANVVLAARRAGKLEEAAALCRSLGVSATAVVTDVSRPEDCRLLIERAGSVDVLVNNAGYAILGPVVEADPEELRRMMATNFLGTVQCTQAVLPQMLERGSGVIVNVASIVGMMGMAGMAGYGATKAATICFSEALRNEVIGKGVRVALVCPATTESEFFEQADRDKMPAAERLVRPITPERVARAICDAAEDGRYRRILPLTASAYMRMKELFPRFAHFLMRRTSSLMERR